MQTKAGFKALLNENNVVVCDRTIEKILQSHSARLLLCVEFGEALALYMEVDRLPQTTTLELLKEQCVFLVWCWSRWRLGRRTEDEREKPEGVVCWCCSCLVMIIR
jgi:hypothetical protein